MLARTRGDARIRKHPLQLARPRAIEPEFHGRRHVARDETRSQSELHVKQYIELAAAQLFPQSVTRSEAGALVHGDKLHAVDETHETRFGLADDPSQLCCRPGML